MSRDGPRATIFRALLGAIGIAVMSASSGCQAADPPVAASRPEIEALEAAYYTILELEKCVDRAPDASDPRLLEQRRRTTGLIEAARGKGLQAHLDRAAAKWRRIDSLADKICYFQTNDFKGSSAQLLREANDRFQLAISRF